MGDRTGLPRIDRTNGYDDGRGYMKAKKSKLAQQNEQIRDALRQRHSAMRTELFKGISINVNGRTQPTADELKRLILLNGGEYHPYYRYQQTKFMIATNLSTARVKNLRPDDRIVKPEWIVDSVKASCILPYQDYQLFADEPRGKQQTGGAITLDHHFHNSDSNSNQASNHSLTNHSTTSNTSTNRPQATIQQLLQANAAAAKANAAGANTSTNSIASSSSKNTTASTNNNNNNNNKRSLNGRGSQTATTSNGAGNNNNNNKKQVTMNDFVVRGLSKANNKFPTPKVKAPQQEMANIIGYTKIDDIVRLINEWVGCPEGVTDEDVACVTKYFYDLMGERNYHNKFCEVMEAFKQRVTDNGEKCWIDLYNDLARTFKNELMLNAEASQSLYLLISYIETEKESEEKVPEAEHEPEPSVSGAAMEQGGASTSKEHANSDNNNDLDEKKPESVKIEQIDDDTEDYDHNQALLDTMEEDIDID